MRSSMSRIWCGGRERLSMQEKCALHLCSSTEHAYKAAAVYPALPVHLSGAQPQSQRVRAAVQPPALRAHAQQAAFPAHTGAPWHPQGRHELLPAVAHPLAVPCAADPPEPRHGQASALLAVVLAAAAQLHARQPAGPGHGLALNVQAVEVVQVEQVALVAKAREPKVDADRSQETA